MRPLFRLLPKLRAAKAAKAERQRKAAWFADRDAINSKRTQVQHITRAALVAATHDKLKIELGYR